MATQQELDGDQNPLHEEERQCPECNEWFKSLGNHWGWNPSHRPNFNKYHCEMMTGLIMGDGSRHPGGKNSLLQVEMITRPFLKWLSKEFDNLANGVRKYHRSPEDAAQNVRERNFRPDACADDYHQMYVFTTIRHQFLNNFLDRWYTEEGIKFLNDIELTPTTLKMWYVSDGSINYNKGCFSHISLSNRTELNSGGKLVAMFDDLPFSVSRSGYSINIPRADTECFFDYVGEQPSDSEAGFAYKWCPYDWDEYSRLKSINREQPYINNQ